MNAQPLRPHEIRKRVVGKARAAAQKRALSELKPPTEGQLRALAHNPKLRAQAMRDCGSAEMFHEWLKMKG